MLLEKYKRNNEQCGFIQDPMLLFDIFCSFYDVVVDGGCRYTQ